MKKSQLLVSVFATGSLLALGMAAPASAQTAPANDPFAPIGGLVSAPVTAAGDIAAAPLTAAGDIAGAPLTAAGQIATAPFAATGLVPPAAPYAQSTRTQAFIATAMPNVNFLNESSRMALDHSKNPAIRRFAHNEAKIQTIAGNSMTAWADTTPSVMSGRSSSNGDPLMGLANLPINAVVGTGNALTGGDIVPSSSGQPLMSSQAEDLSRLSALNGPEFDRLYRSTQLDSLRQLATLYTDYVANGDDPGLRSLARSELPKIKQQIRTINRI